MFCEDKFSRDLVERLVVQYYDRIRENAVNIRLTSSKTNLICFMNSVFNLGVVYSYLTKEKKANAVYNAKSIIKIFKNNEREKRKEEIADVDWEQFVGKYYYARPDYDDYDFFRVDRVLTHKLGITHYLMELEWSNTGDMEVYKVDLYGGEPRAICDSVVDKVKFYFEMDKVEVIDFENFEGQKN